MTQQEDLTRTLASALWRSARLPYSRALDSWLAAEQMVAEALGVARSAPEAGIEADDAVAPWQAEAAAEHRGARPDL